MSWAALFPGQGTQQAQMLPWLEGEPLSAPALRAMEGQIGADWRSRLADERWRSSNPVAQPLLTGVCLAAWAPLASVLAPPVAVAGYSVGELAAFASAGLFEPATALRLAARRAALMDEAMAGEAGGMLSVAGLPAGPVDEVARRFGLEEAIRLGPSHRLLAGTAEALAAAWPALAALGAELKRLAVRTASHASWMRPAAEAFAAELQALVFAPPRSWVISNATGSASRDAARLKQALSRQIDHTVQWQAAMQALGERQPGCVLEIGPGTSLARLWCQAQPQIPVRSLDDFQHWRAAAAWVAAHAG